MTRDAILETLRKNRAELQAHGVRHAALFGSIARGDDGPTSDIDIVIDLDPSRVRTVYDFAGVRHEMQALFDRPVDVISRGGLKPRIKARIERDAVAAF